MSFVHLHTHSEYSLLDGANRLSDLVRRTADLEMPALALTDHGCMFGAWEFQRKAAHAGIKPILGVEAYVAPGDRRDRGSTFASQGSPRTAPERASGVTSEGNLRIDHRPKGRDRAYYHLVLLARDETGYRNLIKLTSIGYREGFYHRPRIDREVLARHADGVIVSSACMASEVAQHLLADRWEQAREAASWYANLFDGRYYLEVQAHDTPGQVELNQRVLRLADELGLPAIATNDAHFLRAEDHDAHDVLLCIGLGKDRDDAKRMRYDGGLYLKGPDEMAGRFADHPEVIENTLAVAETVDLQVPHKYYVPKFPLPEGVKDEAALLRQLVSERARARYGDPIPEHIRERLDYELGVIARPEADYSGYFLIVQDFINWAKRRGIPVGPGRGSAAGSLAAYALGITDVDPLAFDLLFERFLNPDRVSMPDIDIDFCYERRGEVIEYVREKYGHDSVGQIITFGTMKSRAVIRDVGRVLGFEPAETDRLAKLIPNAPNNALTVAAAAERVPELRDLYATDPRVRQLVDYAKVLEGLSRHASVHAAGIVIAPGPLDEYVPVCTQPTRPAGRGSLSRNADRSAANGQGNGGANGRSLRSPAHPPSPHEESTGSPVQAAPATPEDESDEGVLVTQWDMIALEQAGMLKMDFLGLKTLTVIHDAVEWIRRRRGALRHPDTGAEYERIESVPLDDAGVYEMLARGGTTGVFQFESSLASDKLRAMRCDRFEDLVATNALIRPGPLDSGMTDVYIRRKGGREQVRYPDPRLAEVLEPTYGVITYQEQVMRIAQVLAGFTLAEADVLRKAVGKKDADLIQRELEKFVARAVENDVERRVAEHISEQIVTFGRYGFNRSHSVAYALLSYQTAWLKRYYPAELMAALLSSVVDKTDDVVKFIGECRELARYVPGRDEGIGVLPPDVNESEWKFTPVSDTQIRFGLGAVRGLGEQAVRSILAARIEAGPFDSLFDLAERIDLRLVGKRALEALILAGACDSFTARLPSGVGQRARLLAGLDIVLREAQLRDEERASGQTSLFDAPALDAPAQQAPQLPDVAPWPEAERLAREKEILGFFISGHPLDKFRNVVQALERVDTTRLREHRDHRVELPCVVTAVKPQISKRTGAAWARIVVEDFRGTATVLAFGDAWQENREVLKQDAVVLVCGSVSGRDRDEDDPPIFLDSVTPLAELRTSGALALELRLAAETVADDHVITAAARAFREHPGSSPVYVRWTASEDPRLRSRSLAVAPDDTLMERLRELFGPERVRLVKA